MNAFGTNTTEAVKHYISYGMREGRGTDGFNAESYLNINSDVKSAFGNDHDLAKKHFVEYGFAEGRGF
jgi:serralysin